MEYVINYSPTAINNTFRTRVIIYKNKTDSDQSYSKGREGLEKDICTK